MIDNKLYLIVILLLIISASLFIFAFGIKPSLLGFSGEKFISGELWRIISFPFSHVSANHLIENLATLILVTFLSYEFRLTWKQFLISFFLSGIIIAILNIFISPTIIMAGASLGTYAVLGTLAVKGHDFISRKILVIFFGSSIFLVNIINSICPGCVNNISVESTIYHFAGFISGIALFYVLMKRNTKYLDFQNSKM